MESRGEFFGSVFLIALLFFLESSCSLRSLFIFRLQASTIDGYGASFFVALCMQIRIFATPSTQTVAKIIATK